MPVPQKSGRRRRLLWAAALLLFAVSLTLSVLVIGSPPPRSIKLATGDPDGAFAVLGRRYKARLEAMGIRVELVESSGSIDNLHLLRDHKVDVAFVQGGVARSLELADGLCGLAAIGTEPLWIFSQSALRVSSLRDLKGRKVGLGPPESGTEALGRLLLKEHGVTAENTTFVNLAMGQSRQALIDGKVDASILVCSCDAPVISELIHDKNVRLVNPRCQDGIARRLPYLRSATLPEGTLDLERDLPPEDTTLLASVMVLAAREDLHPRVVEQLLMAAKEIHSPGNLLDEQGRFPSLEGMDLPAHVAAVKFMRSGESFFSRVLPYWGVRLVSQAELLLIPIIVLLLPFWKTLPLLYSFRINRLLHRHYAALRAVEDGIVRCEDPTELRKSLEKLDGLRSNLELVSRKLPSHLQREVYNWRWHIAMVRTEASDRLRRLEAVSADG